MDFSHDAFDQQPPHGIPRELAEGACTRHDPELWQTDSPARAHEAKRICLGCPVRRMCLDYALSHVETGIWGGLDADERVVQRDGKQQSPAKANRDVRVARLRAQGWTYQQIAEEYGVSRRTVFRWVESHDPGDLAA